MCVQLLTIVFQIMQTSFPSSGKSQGSTHLTLWENPRSSSWCLPSGGTEWGDLWLGWVQPFLFPNDLSPEGCNQQLYKYIWDSRIHCWCLWHQVLLKWRTSKSRQGILQAVEIGHVSAASIILLLCKWAFRSTWLFYGGNLHWNMYSQILVGKPHGMLGNRWCSRCAVWLSPSNHCHGQGGWWRISIRSPKQCVLQQLVLAKPLYVSMERTRMPGVVELLELQLLSLRLICGMGSSHFSNKLLKCFICL